MAQPQQACCSRRHSQEDQVGLRRHSFIRSYYLYRLYRLYRLSKAIFVSETRLSR